MNSYTEVFNKARIERGLQPTDWTVVLITEGLQLPCGCKVHNASLSHFTTHHGDDCKSIVSGMAGKKYVVGKPQSNLICAAILDQEKKIIGLTNPWQGLWGHEES